MIEEKNKVLNPFKIIKKTYQNVFDKFKSYLVLCYVILLPTFIYQYLSPLEIDPERTQFIDVLPRLTFTLIILIILGIFLYRLFMLDREALFKITPQKLLKIFSKSTLYTVVLAIVLLLALLSVGLLFALVLVVINSVAGENSTDTTIISSIIWMGISLFLILIVFRTLPTFTSIAVGDKLIAMKSAYYYTRDNNKNFIIIAISCYLPMTMISALLAYIVSNIGFELTEINLIISFILLPLSILPYALQISAGTEIYKELVPMEQYSKMKNSDMMV